jgi:lipid-A-disaccharide synthase-like uncharacterized protein
MWLLLLVVLVVVMVLAAAVVVTFTQNSSRLQNNVPSLFYRDSVLNGKIISRYVNGRQDSALANAKDYRLKGTGFDPRLGHRIGAQLERL